MEFKEYRLDEIIEFNPSEKLNKSKKYKKIAMENILPFTKYIRGYNIEEYRGGSKFKNGDTLLARITPCLENGKTAQVNVLEANEVGFGSTEFIVMRSINNVSDSDYIYYLSISNEFRKMSINSMNGSSGRQRVQLDVLKKAIFKIPSLDNQKKIVKILSDIDKKIELNYETNNNLLEISHNVFLNWQDNIKSSKLSKLGVLCEIKYGKGLPTNRIEGDGFPVYGGNGIIGYYSEYMYRKSQVLISCRGAASGKVIFTKPNCFVTNNSLVLECEDKYHFYIKELSLISPYYNYTTGSAQPQITIENIKGIELRLPNDDELDILNKLLLPLEQKYFENESENENLIMLRDMLLPRLMNGEIDLDKIEI